MEALLRTSGARLASLRSSSMRAQGSCTCLRMRLRNHQNHISLPRGPGPSTRLYSSEANSTTTSAELQDKPYYVTTPIFYVNASPHVGHLYSMLLADVIKRWQVLKGKQAYFLTGTDEHGMKVQQAARQQDLHPKALCDANSQIFRDLAARARLDNDYFIRTTDPDHRVAVQYFWDRLQDSGYVYEKTHEGWYCISDETYYPENQVAKTVDPMTGKPQHISLETGNVVEWTQERNYHFRLTAFRDRLLAFYKENPAWVRPRRRMSEVIDWVEHNLEDLSISRPITRLDWGIPVPGDESQTIYVWVDALVNYLTKAGYPTLPPGKEHTGGWPADVHVIGKDIMRFHCVYWPALLMAVGQPLPKQILSHGHWLMDNRKMSKSIGNVVNPFFAIERFGLDTIRYFLLNHGCVSRDPNYSNELVVEAYKTDLQNGLGNLIHRITKGRKWSVRSAVQNMCGQPIEPSVTNEAVHAKHICTVEAMIAFVDSRMDTLSIDVALGEIMRLIIETNKYMTQTTPWKLASSGDVKGTEQAVYLLAESLRIAGILLQPFIPDKAADILDRLNVQSERRGFGFARVHADDAYGLDSTAGKFDDALFPPMEIED